MNCSLLHTYLFILLSCSFRLFYVTEIYPCTIHGALINLTPVISVVQEVATERVRNVSLLIQGARIKNYLKQQ